VPHVPGVSADLRGLFNVQSPVTADVFRLFISAIEGAEISVSDANADGLGYLCDEFQFTELRDQVRAFLSPWVTIHYSGLTRRLAATTVAEKCGKFRCGHAGPYRVQAGVLQSTLQLFLDAIEGADPEISHENAQHLMTLCDEFEFTDLGVKVRAFIDQWATLVFRNEPVHVPRAKLVQKCSLFRDGGVPVARPYQVVSDVAPDVFRVFVGAIDDASPPLTNRNLMDMELLCDEFGYTELSARVAEFLAQHASPAEDQRRYFHAMKELGAALKRMEQRVEQLEADVAALQGENQDLQCRLSQVEPDPYR
jgi:hypothetical protein